MCNWSGGLKIEVLYPGSSMKQYRTQRYDLQLTVRTSANENGAPSSLTTQSDASLKRACSSFQKTGRPYDSRYRLGLRGLIR